MQADKSTGESAGRSARWRRAVPATLLFGALLFGAPLFGAMLSRPARADPVTAKDIQVIGRTLGFMEDTAAGSIELSIVYLRSDPASVHEAHALAESLGTGLAAGKLVLHPRLVASDELGTLDHTGALFIVPSSVAIAAAVAATGQRLHVPTVSTDIACAEAGYCVIAIHTDPTVEIVFNRNAAADAGVRFTPAFRMLVKQV